MGVDGSVQLRVVFWNTWLLRPRIWPGGPAFPGGSRLFAPDVRKRAPLVGAALAGRFDVCALAEVFERSEQEAVAEAWDEASFQPGPGRGMLRATGSGLMTVFDPTNVEVTAIVDHAYRSGGDVRDSDTFATKGALLTRVRVGGGPELDIVSTHLFAGGDLFPVPGHNDQARHHQVRMAQVDELVAFIEAEHDRTTPLLLVGDLNVACHDRDSSLDHPMARYEDLRTRLETLGLVDLWPTYGTGTGSSCNLVDPAQIPVDGDEPDRVADVLEADPHAAPGDRIDYLWLASAGEGGPDVRVERPRRWSFPGRDARGGDAGTLSDHLALSVTLNLHQKG